MLIWNTTIHVYSGFDRNAEHCPKLGRVHMFGLKRDELRPATDFGWSKRDPGSAGYIARTSPGIAVAFLVHDHELLSGVSVYRYIQLPMHKDRHSAYTHLIRTWTVSATSNICATAHQSKVYFRCEFHCFTPLHTPNFSFSRAFCHLSIFSTDTQWHWYLSVHKYAS